MSPMCPMFENSASQYGMEQTAFSTQRGEPKLSKWSGSELRHYFAQTPCGNNG
jgi:hypothetical protein